MRRISLQRHRARTLSCMQACVRFTWLSVFGYMTCSGCAHVATGCAAARLANAATPASQTAQPARGQKGTPMADEKHTTEEYWGSTIDIKADPQGDGMWKATALVRSPGGYANNASPFKVESQPTADAATAVARNLAAAEIDRQRVSRGKS